MIREYYQKRLEEEGEDLKSLERKTNQVSNWRLLAIVASAVIFYFLLKTSIFIAAGSWIIIIAGFFYLVKYHDSLAAETELKRIKTDVLKNEIQYLSTAKNRYDNGAQYEQPKHPYTADLDVFGEFSLFAKTNRAKTHKGQNYLSDALTTIASATSIAQKQRATAELAKKDKWRQNFQASLFELHNTETEGLTSLEEPEKLTAEGLIFVYKYFKWLIPVLLFSAFYFWGVTAGTLSLFGFLGLHFMLSGINRKITEPYFQKIKGISKDLEKYALATQIIIKEDFESEVLKNAKAQLPLSQSSENPIHEFLTIYKKIDMKNNQLAAFFLYLFSPFDLVQLIVLRKWVNTHPDFFSHIFEVIGTFELYSSLGTLAFNEKGWVFPDLYEDENLSFEIKDAGHPLMDPSVTNTFVFNEANRLSLITGSNMSGKSTFLRTIGCNIILAYAGAPVFASSFRLVAGIHLYAYMRIKDSLQENASTFKAEIDRIKLLLEAMRTQPKSLILVDEMLRGTNSEDKLKGSIAFLEEVIKAHAYAMVATHDLRTTELAGKYPESVQNFFFEYESNGGELTFDYKLKEGVCQSFNASELLRSVGLDV